MECKVVWNTHGYVEERYFAEGSRMCICESSIRKNNIHLCQSDLQPAEIKSYKVVQPIGQELANSISCILLAWKYVNF